MIIIYAYNRYKKPLLFKPSCLNFVFEKVCPKVILSGIVGVANE